MFSALPQVPRRPVVAGDHDLAVDQERRCLDAMRGINDGREAVGPVMAVAPEERTRRPSRRTITDSRHA